MVLLVAGTSVFLCSLLLIDLLKVRGTVAVLLGLVAISWAQIVIVVEGLSLVRGITPGYVLAGQILATGLIAIIWWRREYPSTHRLSSLSFGLLRNAARERISTLRYGLSLWRFASHWFVTLIAICAIAVLTTSLVLAITTPPNDGDSLSYHLARTIQWRQQHSLAHYITHYEHQNCMPVVSEIGMLWTILLAGTDRFAALAQWSALLATLLALYGICRALGYRISESTGISCLFSTLSVVALQAATALNDLILTAFLAATVFFTLIGLKNRERQDNLLLLAGLSFGLFLGTKGTAWLFLPGLALWAFGISLLYWHRLDPELLRRWRTLALALAGLVSVLLFCSYNWIQNMMSYGNPLLAPGEAARQRVVDPGPATWVSNMTRTLARFYDYPQVTGQPIADPGVQAITWGLDRIHEGLHIGVSSPRTTYSGLFQLQATRLYNDALDRYFGLLGIFLVWPSLIGLEALCAVSVLKRRPHRESLFSAGLLGLVSLAFFACFTLFLKWQAYSGRFYMGFVLLALPATVWIFRLRPAWLRTAVQVVLAFLMTGTVVLCLIDNASKPILPGIRGRSILSMDAVEIQFIDRPRLQESFELVNAFVPADSRLGLGLAWGDWEYPYCSQLARTCIQIGEEQWTKHSPGEIMDTYNLDALLVRPQWLPPDFSAARLPPTIRALRLLQADFYLFLRTPPDPFPRGGIPLTSPTAAGGRARLIGYDWLKPQDRQLQPGQPLALRLYWQVLGSPVPDFTTEVRLSDHRSGSTWTFGSTTSNLQLPVEDIPRRYPSPQWKDNEIVVEQLSLVPDLLPAGEYQPQLSFPGLDPAGRSATQQPVTLPETLHVAASPGQELQPAAYQLKTAEGQHLELRGYRLSPQNARPGDVLHLDLLWQINEPLPVDQLAVFVHLRRDQKTVAQADQPSLACCLSPGESFIITHHNLPLGENLHPGTYEIRTGLYRPDTSQRLEVADDTSGENAIILTPIKVLG